MVKDANSSIKKKRKSGSTNDADAEIDVYKKVVDFEEKEAQQRDGSIDADLYSIICQEVRDSICEVLQIKSKSNEDIEYKQQLFTKICVKIAIIKKLNRVDKIQHVFGKEALSAEKQKCDSIKLQYQNLVYELHHLLSEINKCMAFKSKDEEIELVSLEQFLKEAPESVTKKFQNIDENDSEQMHALRLARLEFELEQRKSLAQLCKSLEEEKKVLGAEIVERKKKLDELLPLLTTVLNATKPLQDHLDIPIDQVRQEHKLAHLLPDPLYIFYANCMSYKTVYDSNLKIAINGNQEAAMQWKANQESIQDEEDSDTEMENTESEEIVVKKRRHRKSVQVDPMEEKKRKLKDAHPLSIEVTTEIKDGPSITLIISYITKLKIVTVKSSVVIPNNITGNAARDILAGENMLSELIEGDLGTDSPNPSTPYQLKKVGLNSFQGLVGQIGHAYNWAQGVCGLNFLMKQSCSDAFARTNVEIVMKTLQKRLQARTDLANQLQHLEQNSIPKVPVTVNLAQNYVSSLTKWSSITYQTYCQSEFTKCIVEEEIVQPSDMFYSATFTRLNAKLQAFIAIKNSYPVPPPIFSLCLNYNGLFHSGNSDEIRDIERNLFVDWDENESSSWLLSAQIMQLCSYFDVLMETLDSKPFEQNAMFLKKNSGRNRRRPFKFRKIGTGIFTQY